MSKTADNGFLPAMTEEQIIEISKREAARHATTLFQLTGDSGTTEEYIEDLAQSFALGALEALKNNEDGKAIRTYQWNYGRGHVLKRLHEIIDNINEARTPIDTSGGAFTKDESENDPGYAPAADDAEPLDLLANDDAKAEAVAALKRLPEHFQEVLTLRLIEEKSFDEISRALNITAGCARMRYFYGLDKLRAEFAAA